MSEDDPKEATVANGHPDDRPANRSTRFSAKALNTPDGGALYPGAFS